MTPVPQQYMAALARANETRLAGADACRAVRALGEHEGRLEVARLLRSGPFDAGRDVWSRIPVNKLISAIHRFGPQRAGRALNEAGIVRHDRRVCDLTARQREALAETVLVLGDRQDRREAA